MNYCVVHLVFNLDIEIYFAIECYLWCKDHIFQSELVELQKKSYIKQFAVAFFKEVINKRIIFWIPNLPIQTWYRLHILEHASASLINEKTHHILSRIIQECTKNIWRFDLVDFIVLFLHFAVMFVTEENEVSFCLELIKLARC